MKSKIIIISILALAILIRVLPIMRFGIVLDEYDPYFNFKVVKFMYENGLRAFMTWHDDSVWHPKGRDIFKTCYPGMMIYTYLLHKAINQFHDISVYDICVLFPILGGLITLLSVYKITKLISNKNCAIIALFLCAITPGLLQRTLAGFYDYECIGIALINFSFYYYLKYIKSQNIYDAWGFLICYFNLGICWGGYVIVMNLIALHCAFSMITYRYKNRLLRHFPNLIPKFYDSRSYIILYLIGNSLLYIVPIIGKGCFISQEQIVPLITLFLHLFAFKNLRVVTIFSIPIIIYTSNAAFKSGKLFNLFVKQKGSALVESISEHAPRSFVKYFLDCNILCLFVPLSFGVLYDLENTFSAFMFIYLVVSVFVSAKILRCILVAAPCFCISASFYIMKLYDEVKKSIFKKRIFIGVSTIITIFYTLHSFCVSYYVYSTPQILLITNDGGVFSDFTEAYQFLSRFEGVILNWWDYGYQINAYSIMKTLNDNNTNDWDRIKEVAQIFMSTEKDAHTLCLKNKIDCVFIVSGIDSGFNQDMISKGGWIERIACENCNFKSAGVNGLMYKLVYYGNNSTFDNARQQQYNPVDLTHFALAYRSENNIVKLYQVKK